MTSQHSVFAGGLSIQKAESYYCPNTGPVPYSKGRKFPDRLGKMSRLWKAPPVAKYQTGSQKMRLKTSQIRANFTKSKLFLFYFYKKEEEKKYCFKERLTIVTIHNERTQLRSFHVF